MNIREIAMKMIREADARGTAVGFSNNPQVNAMVDHIIRHDPPWERLSEKERQHYVDEITVLSSSGLEAFEHFDTNA